jgi:hypothetical protein
MKQDNQPIISLCNLIIRLRGVKKPVNYDPRDLLKTEPIPKHLCRLPEKIEFIWPKHLD